LQVVLSFFSGFQLLDWNGISLFRPSSLPSADENVLRGSDLQDEAQSFTIATPCIETKLSALGIAAPLDLFAGNHGGTLLDKRNGDSWHNAKDEETARNSVT